jgi:pyruvate, water dikinase
VPSAVVAVSRPWVVGLDDPAAADTAVVGGKGAGLHRLVALGGRVPAGFVVSTAAFAAALGEGVDVEAPLRELGPEAPLDVLEQAADRARAALLDAAGSSPVLDAVREAYVARVGADTRVAVRSSAVGEDAAGASFAGEHDTYLELRGPDAVADAVARCWASLYTARAISYRQRAAVGGGAGAMAVVVQEMVRARAAGVFMTLNPANGDRSTVVCEAVWGLGEPLVSGEVTPDRYVIDKISGEVVRREIAVKTTRLTRTEDGPGTVVADVPPDDRERPCLDDAELAALLAVARRIERDAGVPQDGEFAVADPGGADAVHLLQTRPETVWSARAPRSAAPAPGVGSALSAVLATLTRSAREDADHGG